MVAHPAFIWRGGWQAVSGACLRRLFGLLLLGAWACGGGDAPHAHVELIAPGSDDHSCIGVAGFEATVQSAGQMVVDHQPLVGGAPVLRTSDCHLPSALSKDALDRNKPLDVEIAGYDSARVLRVRGTTHLDGLDAPPQPLSLQGTPASQRPVLVVDVRSLVAGQALQEVTTLEIRTQQRNELLLAVTIDAAVAPYFQGAEPAAFTLQQGSIGTEDLVIAATLRGGMSYKGRFSVQTGQGNLYLLASPLSKHP